MLCAEAGREQGGRCDRWVSHGCDSVSLGRWLECQGAELTMSQPSGEATLAGSKERRESLRGTGGCRPVHSWLQSARKPMSWQEAFGGFEQRSDTA